MDIYFKFFSYSATINLNKFNFMLPKVKPSIFIKKKKKAFTFVRSPKCFKVGKKNYMFQYYIVQIHFYLHISNKILVTNIFNVFKFWRNFFKIYNILNYQLKINSKTDLRFVKMLSIFLLMYNMFIIFSFSTMGGLISIWIFFLLMFLQVLFFTSCERKILALTQRRLGPHHVGDRGRLQYFADAIKLIVKNISAPKNIPNLMFQAAAVGAFWISWFTFSNLTFAPGISIWNIDYNIFFFMICSQVFSIVWLVSGWASSSKYALLGCIRAGIQILSYELFSSLIFLNLFILTSTTNFDVLISIQETIPLFFVNPVLGVIAFITALIETNRPPFDLSEAESDVVAGYTVEYGGILFGLFYLAEYINIFTNAIVLTILFFGGWANYFQFFDYYLLFLKNNFFFFNSTNLFMYSPLDTMNKFY